MPTKTKINSLNYLFTLGFTFIQILALAGLGNIGAYAAENTANLIIGREDKGTTVDLSTCVQSTGTNTIKLADVSTWFDLTDFSTTPTITEEGKFTAASGFYDPAFQKVEGTVSTWSQRLTYTGSMTGGLEISTTPELFMKNTLTKTGSASSVTLHVDPGAEWFTVPGEQITFTISYVDRDCRMPAVVAKTLGTNPTGVLTGTIGQAVTGSITTTSATYSGPAQYVNGTCIINGNIAMGIFTPTVNQMIPANCPTGALTAGTLVAAGTTTLGGVASNFMAAAVVKTPITLENLKNTDLKCNDNKNVIKNSTTTCTFTLPTDKTLPADLKLAIGDATPAGTCTLSGMIVTCTNIPTGSLTGKQPIISQLGTGAKVDTTKTAMVDSPVITVVNTGASTSSTPTIVKPSTVTTLSKTGTNSIFLIAGSIAMTLGGIAMLAIRKFIKK